MCLVNSPLQSQDNISELQEPQKTEKLDFDSNDIIFDAQNLKKNKFTIQNFENIYSEPKTELKASLVYSEIFNNPEHKLIKDEIEKIKKDILSIERTSVYEINSQEKQFKEKKNSLSLSESQNNFELNVKNKPLKIDELEWFEKSDLEQIKDVSFNYSDIVNTSIYNDQTLEFSHQDDIIIENEVKNLKKKNNFKYSDVTSLNVSRDYHYQIEDTNNFDIDEENVQNKELTIEINNIKEIIKEENENENKIKERNQKFNIFMQEIVNKESDLNENKEIKERNQKFNIFTEEIINNESDSNENKEIKERNQKFNIFTEEIINNESDSNETNNTKQKENLKLCIDNATNYEEVKQTNFGISTKEIISEEPQQKANDAHKESTLSIDNETNYEINNMKQQILNVTSKEIISEEPKQIELQMSSIESNNIENEKELNLSINETVNYEEIKDIKLQISKIESNYIQNKNAIKEEIDEIKEREITSEQQNNSKNTKDEIELRIDNSINYEEIKNIKLEISKTETNYNENEHEINLSINNSINYEEFNDIVKQTFDISTNEIAEIETNKYLNSLIIEETLNEEINNNCNNDINNTEESNAKERNISLNIEMTTNYEHINNEQRNFKHTNEEIFMKYHRGIVNLELSSPNEYENITEQKYNFDTFEISSIKTKSNHQNKEIDLSICPPTNYESNNKQFEALEISPIASNEIKSHDEISLIIDENDKVNSSIDITSEIPQKHSLKLKLSPITSNETKINQKLELAIDETSNYQKYNEDLTKTYENEKQKSLKLSSIISNETQNKNTIDLEIKETNNYDAISKEITSESPKIKKLELSPIQSNEINNLENEKNDFEYSEVTSFNVTQENKYQIENMKQINIESENKVKEPKELTIEINNIKEIHDKDINEEEIKNIKLEISKTETNYIENEHETNLSINNTTNYEEIKNIKEVKLEISKTETNYIENEHKLKLSIEDLLNYEITPKQQHAKLEISHIKSNYIEQKPEISLIIDKPNVYEEICNIKEPNYVTTEKEIISETPKQIQLEISKTESNYIENKQKLNLSINNLINYEEVTHNSPSKELEISHIVSNHIENEQKLNLSIEDVLNYEITPKQQNVKLEISHIESNYIEQNPELILSINTPNVYEESDNNNKKQIFDISSKQIITEEPKKHFNKSIEAKHLNISNSADDEKYSEVTQPILYNISSNEIHQIEPQNQMKQLQMCLIQSNEFENKQKTELSIDNITNYDIITNEVITEKPKQIQLQISKIESNYIENKQKFNLCINNMVNYEEVKNIKNQTFDISTNEVITEKPKQIQLQISKIESNYIENEHKLNLSINDILNYEIAPKQQNAKLEISHIESNYIEQNPELELSIGNMNSYEEMQNTDEEVYDVSFRDVKLEEQRKSLKVSANESFEVGFSANEIHLALEESSNYNKFEESENKSENNKSLELSPIQSNEINNLENEKNDFEYSEVTSFNVTQENKYQIENMKQINIESENKVKEPKELTIEINNIKEIHDKDINDEEIKEIKERAQNEDTESKELSIGNSINYEEIKNIKLEISKTETNYNENEHEINLSINNSINYEEFNDIVKQTFDISTNEIAEIETNKYLNSLIIEETLNEEINNNCNNDINNTEESNAKERNISLNIEMTTNYEHINNEQRNFKHTNEEIFMKYHRGIVNLELSSPNEYENITEQKYNFDTFEISSIKTKSNHQNKEIDLSIDNSSTYEGCQRLPNPTFDISATKVIATEEPQKQIKQNLKYYTNDPIDINQSKQIDLSIDNSSTYEGYQRLPNPNLSFASNEIIASEEPQKQIREFNEIENPFVVEESLQFEYDTIDEPNNYKSLEVSPIESNETQNEQIHLSIDNSSTYEGCQRLPHPNLSISANEIIAEQPQSKQIKLSIDSASMHEWCLQLPNPTFGISSNSIIISEAPQNKESDLSIGSASIEQLNNSNLSVSTNEIISKASQTVHKPLKLSPFAANETQCKEIDLSIDSASIYEGCQRLSNADLDVTSNTIIISQEPQIKIENVTTQNDNKTLEISPIEVNETKDKEVDLEIDYSSTYEGCERIVDVSEKQIIISEDPTNNAKIRSLEISPIEVNETKDKEVDLAIDYSSIYEGCERIVDVSEKQIIISEDPTNNSKIRSLEISPIEVNEAKDNEIDLAIDYSSTYEGCERIVAPKFDVTTKEIITTKEKNNFKLEISRIESNEIKDKHTNDLMITEVSNYEECERIIAPKFDFTTKEIVNYENHNILELSPVESNYIENEYLADLVIEDSSNYEGCDRFIIPKFDFMTNETFSEEPKTEFHKPFKLTVDASTQHETKNEENLTLLTYTIFDQIGNETNLEISSVNEVTENHFPTLTITRQSPYYIYSFGMPGSCNYSPQLLPSKVNSFGFSQYNNYNYEIESLTINETNNFSYFNYNENEFIKTQNYNFVTNINEINILPKINKKLIINLTNELSVNYSDVQFENNNYIKLIKNQLNEIRNLKHEIIRNGVKYETLKEKYNQIKESFSETISNYINTNSNLKNENIKLEQINEDLNNKLKNILKYYSKNIRKQKTNNLSISNLMNILTIKEENKIINLNVSNPNSFDVINIINLRTTGKITQISLAPINNFEPLFITKPLTYEFIKQKPNLTFSFNSFKVNNINTIDEISNSLHLEAIPEIINIRPKILNNLKIQKINENEILNENNEVLNVSLPLVNEIDDNEMEKMKNELESERKEKKMLMKLLKRRIKAMNKELAEQNARQNDLLEELSRVRTNYRELLAKCN